MVNQHKVARYKEKNNQKMNGKVKGKKLVIILVIVILLILIFGQLLYYFVLPRVSIDLKTVYHEAMGGGGTGGLININSKFINSGTVDVENLKITVTILDSTNKLLTNETHEQGIVNPNDNHEVKLKTNGNTFEKFYIIVEIEFNTEKNEYSKKYLYETHEDAMNIGFEDNISDWIF